MTDAGIAEQAAHNGHAGDGESPRGLAARLVASMREQVQLRIPRADLDERDPDYIRESLPRLWLLASLWFRGEVRGLGNIPEEGAVVPVVAIGGQETALFLSRGEGLSRLLRMDRMFRLKVLPISIALPWGLNVGDMLGHVPLPSKIIVEALPPIHLREEFGPEPDVGEVYDHLMRTMQETLDALAAERRLPVIG